MAGVLSRRSIACVASTTSIFSYLVNVIIIMMQAVNNKAARRHFVSVYKFPHGRQELDPNHSTTACKIVVLPGRVPFGFRISMAEDHVLFLAPKSFASKLSKREGKIGVLNNDVSFDVDAGMNRTTSSGLCQSHECHHHVSLC
jgi:hypothetical protein